MPYDHTLPEAARNRLLRRADWRFLLPDPSPKRALCLADGFLSEAVAASVNTCDIHCAGTYDLVVLDRLDTKCLRTAFERLRSGGSIYIESRRSAEVIKRL